MYLVWGPMGPLVELPIPMIWLSLLALAPAITAILAYRRHREPAEEQLWGPAKTALVEAEVLSPLDAPDCPKVDTAWLRSEYSREQYERAYFAQHGEYPPSWMVVNPDWGET